MMKSRYLLFFILVFHLVQNNVHAQVEGYERLLNLQNINTELLTVDGAVTSDGGYIMFSLYQEADTTDHQSANLTKLNAKGTVLWSNNYYLEDSLILNRNGDLVLLPEDSIMITTSYTVDTNHFQVVMLLDADGNQVSSRQYNLIGDSLTMDIHPRLLFTKDSLYVSSALSNANDLSFPYIINHSGNGTLNWGNQYFAEDSLGNALSINYGEMESCFDKGMVMAGIDLTNNNIYVMKVDSFGLPSWNYTFLDSTDKIIANEVRGVVQLPDSTYLIAANIRFDSLERERGLLIKLDTIGRTIWSKHIQLRFDSINVHLNDMVLSTDGNVLLSGRNINPLISSTIGFKFDYDGTLLWQTIYKEVQATELGLGGLSAGANGGMVYMVNGGNGNSNKYLPNLIVTTETGTTLCHDTLIGDLFIDQDIFVDTFRINPLPIIYGDTITLTDAPFGGIQTPIVDLEEMTFCPNEPINFTLDANTQGATEYLWNDGSSADTLLVTEEGTYSVIVTIGEDFCYQLCDSAKIDVYELPDIFISSNTNSFCQDSLINLMVSVVSLEATPIQSIEWSTGEIDQVSIKVPAGQYFVTVTDACGEQDVDDVIVSYPVLVDNVFLEDNITTICDEKEFRLIADISPDDAQNVTYEWSNGEIESSITVTQPGLYFVTVTDFCGTEFVQSVPINEYPILVEGLSIIDNGNSFCETEIFSLSAIPSPENANNLSFLWSTGETSSTINVSDPGTYTVTLTDFCEENTMSITLTANDIPTLLESASILENLESICNMTSFELLADVDPFNASVTAYEWSSGQSETNVLTFNEPGTYSLTVTDICDHQFSDEVTISLLPELLPEVNIVSDCQEDAEGNDTLTLTVIGVPEGFQSISWSDGQTQESIQANLDGTLYNVVVTDFCGNVSEASFEAFESFCSPACLSYPNLYYPQSMDEMNQQYGPVLFNWICDREQIFDYELKIFNRWGELVFSTTDLDEEWDGMYKDSRAPSEVYMFYATYNYINDEFKTKGSFTLLR